MGHARLLRTRGARPGGSVRGARTLRSRALGVACAGGPCTDGCALWEEGEEGVCGCCCGGAGGGGGCLDEEEDDEEEEEEDGGSDVEIEGAEGGDDDEGDDGIIDVEEDEDGDGDDDVLDNVMPDDLDSEVGGLHVDTGDMEVATTG